MSLSLETGHVHEVYKHELMGFPLKAIAFGSDWEPLEVINNDGTTIVAENHQSGFKAFVEALGNGDPAHVIFCDVNNEEDFHDLAKFYIAKSAIAVTTYPGADRAILRKQLVDTLGSENATDYALEHPSCLPHLVVRTSDPSMMEKLKKIGGINAVIGSSDDLEQSFITAKGAAHARARALAKLNADSIASTLPQIAKYIDLRKLENVSSDTVATLEHLNEAFEEHTEYTGMKINRVLEAGVGEGRIAILLYLMGREVVGVDVTQERLESSQIRLLGEAENFVSGEIPEEGTLARVAWDSMSNDERVARKNQISSRLDEIKSQYSAFSRQQQAKLFAGNDFFMMQSEVQRLGDFELQVLQQEVQAVVFAWNTFNFMGGPDQMVRVLNRMYDTLPKKGLIFIEIPDRETGPYPDLLADYMVKHPLFLPGMLESRPQSQGDMYEEDENQPGAVRYFPSQEEMEGYLKLCGFELRLVLRHTVVPQDDSMKEHTFDELTFIAVRE